jgi:UDP-N-acetylglucosamine 2-epimerase (non-hydrolysing)
MSRHKGFFDQLLVHTGQHYDPTMSDIFFNELELPEPDINLGVGSGSHAWQTSQVMVSFEPALLEFKPDWVCVVGDVNSTLACSLVAVKAGFKVAHVEAGLRSFDRSMPEEINRVLTDQIAELLFTHSEDAGANLRGEGISSEKIHFVGNIMIDTLVSLLPATNSRWIELRDRLGLGEYILVTLHRPSNVDNPQVLREILIALSEISSEIPVLFPIHPRTRRQINVHGLAAELGSVGIIEPIGYLDFLALQAHARLVLTDSGGVQEETTYLGVPCLTARANTERPVTITEGTNQLVASNAKALIKAMRSRLEEGTLEKRVPSLWDGHTAERIVRIIRSF